LSAFIKNLWPAIKNGDQAAWSELVARYSGLVLTVAKKVGLTGTDAEDCAQHTWTALFHNRHSLKDPESLPSWLIITTKRHAIKILKKQQRDDRLIPEIHNPNNAIPPDEELLKLELQDIVEHALEQLDSKCQKLLLALFLSDERQSYQEIARQLNLSANTMGSLRSRCLKKLSEILKNLGYLEH
jgi:RNA polymerase sigma factor (sigma-70 family)